MPTISEQLTQLISDRDDLVDNLTTKGITGLTGDETFTELVPEVLNIPSGGTPVIAPMKDVNFYDYDGTRLYSYTLSEIQELTELPALPSHTGLTCQGWNWTLADIKAEGIEIDVGATYITDDGKTRLYIRIDELGRTSVPLCFQQSVANGVEVNWGDGSATETFSGDGTTNIFPIHTYSSIGEYVITLNPLNDCQLVLGGKNTSYCIMGETNNTNAIYRLMLYKAFLGRNSNIDAGSFTICSNLQEITIPIGLISTKGSSFEGCTNLRNIVFPNTTELIDYKSFTGCNFITNMEIPNSVKSFSSYSLYNCNHLTRAVIPTGVTAIGGSAFTGCSSLSYIKIPNTVTTIQASFNNCINLTSITIPNSVTSIGSAFQGCTSLVKVKMSKNVRTISKQLFNNCVNLLTVDFSEYTEIPALENINAFNGLPNDCKIIVPDSLYEDWIVATNWSTYASYIIKKTDWEAL